MVRGSGVGKSRDENRGGVEGRKRGNLLTNRGHLVEQTEFDSKSPKAGRHRELRPSTSSYRHGVTDCAFQSHHMVTESRTEIMSTSQCSRQPHRFPN